MKNNPHKRRCFLGIDFSGAAKDNFWSSLFRWKLRLLLFLLGTILASCGTPQAVRDLSTAQYQAQGEAFKQLNSYFSVVESFVSTQVDLASDRIDKLTDKNSTDREKIASVKIAKNPEGTAPLSEFRKGIEEDMKLRESSKEELQKHLATIKAKHADFRKAYQTLIAAQEKLDEYIQLEKADERAFNAILQKIGVSKEQLNATVTDLAQAANSLDSLIKP